MKNEKIMNAMGQIRDDLIENAVILPEKKKHAAVWVKWAAMAACLCFVLCGLFMMKNSTPVPPIADDKPPVTDPVFRGQTNETPGNETTTPNNDVTSSNENGENIGVYKITSLDLNVEGLLDNLESEGWTKTECTIAGEYSFFLKGTIGTTHTNLTDEECKELAKIFMTDSGLAAHLEKYDVVNFAYESSAADGLIVTYCYFLCEGERTGAYIRFVFEGYKHIGEVQANVYASECIDNLTLLSLDDALKTAYMKNSDGKLEEINANDYRIQNVKLIYVNGLPYYKFTGFGINNRAYIDGFALAVNIIESDVPTQLLEQHAAFKFE